MGGYASSSRGAVGGGGRCGGSGAAQRCDSANLRGGRGGGGGRRFRLSAAIAVGADVPPGAPRRVGPSCRIPAGRWGTAVGHSGGAQRG